MRKTTIFHTDLPQEMRWDPYCRKNTGRLTKIVWQRAQGSGLEPPFGLDRMSDRIVVRKLKPADAQRAEVAA